MDVGADPEDTSQARQQSPDSSEREARRLRAPWDSCPECGAAGRLTDTSIEIVPYVDEKNPVQVAHYVCANGHRWRFPPAPQA
jgi:hypothetical protein